MSLAYRKRKKNLSREARHQLTEQTRDVSPHLERIRQRNIDKIAEREFRRIKRNPFTKSLKK